MTTATKFGGDVAGGYDDLQLGGGVVGEAELSDGAVTSAKIGITCDEGQVLKYVDGAWKCAADTDSLLTEAKLAALLSGWDQAESDDLTVITEHSGDVSGTFDALQLGAAVVGAEHLKVGAVSADKLGFTVALPADVAAVQAALDEHKVSADHDDRFVNVAGDAMEGDLTVASKVGIGTTKPGTTLHVAKEGMPIVRVDGTGDGAQAQVTLGTPDGEYTLRHDSAHLLRVIWDQGSEKTITVVDGATGRVGIGTPAPASTLDVAGTVTATGLECSGCIDQADLATSAVGTDALADGSVTKQKLGFSAAETADVNAVTTALDEHKKSDDHADTYVNEGQDNSVAANMIKDGAVHSSGLADGAVLASKLGVVCPDGELIRYDDDKKTWVCAPDADTQYTAGIGLNLDGLSFAVDQATIEAWAKKAAFDNLEELAAAATGWDQNAGDDLTKATAFSGDVAGKYDSLKLGSHVVAAGHLQPESGPSPAIPLRFLRGR